MKRTLILRDECKMWISFVYMPFKRIDSLKHFPHCKNTMSTRKSMAFCFHIYVCLSLSLCAISYACTWFLSILTRFLWFDRWNKPPVFTSIFRKYISFRKVHWIICISLECMNTSVSGRRANRIFCWNKSIFNHFSQENTRKKTKDKIFLFRLLKTILI